MVRNISMTSSLHFRNISHVFRFTLTAAVVATVIAASPPVAHAEPNKQMKQVLDTYATLSPIPLEKRRLRSQKRLQLSPPR